MIRNTISGTLVATFLLYSTTRLPALEDFNTFTAETYQATSGFAPANWVTADLVLGSGDGLVVGELNNSFPTVFYNNADVLGSRIKYLYEPGADDDLTGFVLGFQPGDTINPNPGGAGFLLFDWKRVEQNFDFADPGEGGGGIPNFNDGTAASTAPAALRASWVSGVPTSDELWGKENQAVNTFGGVTPIANATNLGATGYTAGQSYVMEIEYSANQARLLVDGVEEFHFTPADVPGGPATFPSGRFGLYEAYQSPGSISSQLDIRPLGEASAADPPPLPDPLPLSLSSGVKAFALDVTSEDAAANAAAWSVVRSSPGSNQAFVITAPNNGDVDVAFGPSDPSTDPRVQLGLAISAVQPVPADGVMLATVRENGGRPRANAAAPPIYGTVEAPADSGFGGVGYGLAIAETPDGSESTASVAAAFFPYADGWTGGSVGPDGAISSGNGPATVAQLTPPAPSTQNGLYNVSIGSANSQLDGLLFVVGGSNENNLAGATPLSDGTWNVAVRDNGLAGFAGADEFEADRFNFVYVGIDSPAFVGGQVTGFAADMTAEMSLAAGSFTLSKEGVGQYRLTIDGQTPDDGVLMLTNAEPHLLSDGTVAPANYYMTYEADNSDFLIEMRQIVVGSAPLLVDGQFSFAYVSYTNPLQVPEPAGLTLAVTGWLLLLVLRRRAPLR